MNVRRSAAVGAYAVLAALVTVDVRIHGATIAGSYAVVPLIAAFTSGVRGTAAAGAVTLVATIAATVLTHSDAAAGTARLVTVCASTFLAVALARTSRRRERRLADVTRVADVVQRSILRPVPPAIGDVRIAAAYRSASREAHIGGDLYDVVPHGGGLRLVIGDVRGKGLAAVQTTAHVLAAFRDAAEDHESLVDLARELHRRMRRQLGDEDFVTALVADVIDGELRMVSCGHPTPVILRGCRVLQPDATAAPPLGVGPASTMHRQTLLGGDRVVFFTDGLTEARDRSGRFAPWLPMIAACRTALDAGGAVAMVVEQVERATRGTLGDDLAVLVLDIHQTPASPG